MVKQKHYNIRFFIARVHNIACVNCSTCTYFFPKQTENWVPRNSIEPFYSHPCLMFDEMRYILTLHEKHNMENKWPPIQVSNKKTSVERYLLNETSLIGQIFFVLKVSQPLLFTNRRLLFCLIVQKEDCKFVQRGE